jgi:hypothetical protein
MRHKKVRKVRDVLWLVYLSEDMVQQSIICVVIHGLAWLGSPRAIGQSATRSREGKGTDKGVNLEVEGCGPQQDSHLKNDQGQGCFPKFP